MRDPGTLPGEKSPEREMEARDRDDRDINLLSLTIWVSPINGQKLTPKLADFSDQPEFGWNFFKSRY